jgi:hypothetical protein
MQKISERTVGRTDGASSWTSRNVGTSTVLVAILYLALLLSPVQALSVTGNGVTLAWDRSPDSSVTGYRIYYGAASGNYTNSVAVGNATTNVVQGLAGGVTYFFAVTAYDASGLESSFSNETSYTVPTGLPALQLRMASNGQAVLTVQGQIGHTYEIQTSPDLKTWTAIVTAIVGASGSVDFADTNAASFSKRFYRTRDIQP